MESSFSHLRDHKWKIPAQNGPNFGQQVTEQDLKRNKITIVNFFSSWCGPCRVEHPLLLELQSRGAHLVGINYRDNSEDARDFLAALGNPYSTIASDIHGVLDPELEISGIPETYLVNAEGRIIYKHHGRLKPHQIEQEIIPILERTAS